MIQYRIYTEDKNRADIETIVARHFDSFTIIPTIGYWKGVAENSLIIEIFGNDQFTTVKEVAEYIKELNKQECVLVTRTPLIHSELI
jgi:hypothetical protein